MNIHAHAYMTDTPLAARRALDDAIAIYDNDDGVSRPLAIDAIASGRAAFWSSARYHSAVSCELLNAANRGPIFDALSIIPPHCASSVDALLDTLVPLNAKAANALSLAYAERGLWRDDAELLMRAKRDCRKAVA